ncbi:hypothetical protein [Pseudoalteromonas denitrificans]|uniref:Uncharacterized protein n=1 Tax=Pseudoalteromonas denitrificans DSM 6059 TaxID=1123010 RepID=A0A1I1RKI1_9GAMM|nr:hypothetical protein [Pseudoalteromonas denitrificans]SFD34855.1 hypothetical protein SAMN02745724_04273 [Pseudoalteromonas denitrificans DSM 6059]
MPRYHQLVSFMADVRRANPGFTLKRSSLKSLIALLNDSTSTAMQITMAMQKIPVLKAAKYRDALWYLQVTYPGFHPLNLPIGIHSQGKTNAARYSRTPLTQAYDPSSMPPTRNIPPSAWLNQTVEQWLLTENGSVGVVIIHLSGLQDPMKDLFNGRASVDHMNSVLRIARLKGADLLCLHMKGNPVCPELSDAANAYGDRKTDILISKYHMGGHSADFINFANTHDHVVVIGFDADICVNANLFGANEKSPNGQYIPPLTSLTNVVTSRALLVTTGLIYPIGNRNEYGVINAT